MVSTSSSLFHGRPSRSCVLYSKGKNFLDKKRPTSHGETGSKAAIREAGKIHMGKQREGFYGKLSWTHIVEHQSPVIFKNWAELSECTFQKCSCRCPTKISKMLSPSQAVSVNQFLTHLSNICSKF